MGLLSLLVLPLSLAAGEPYPLIEGKNYQGVVLPPSYFKGENKFFGLEVQGFWEPSRKNIAQAEKAVRQAVFSAKDDPGLLDVASRTIPVRQAYMQEQISKIIPEFSTYRRQYTGLMIKGKKKIYCNFFAGEFAEKQAPEWRWDFISVFDGGYRFWNIIYDLESDSCESFHVNG